jgi:hypothetical protein
MRHAICKSLILLVMGLFCSCDPGSSIAYKVNNKTNANLSLTIKPSNGKEAGATYELYPNDEITIYKSRTLGYSSEVIKNKSMEQNFLKSIFITKDSIPLNLNYTNESIWTRESVGDTLAIYRLTIHDDFINYK